MQNNEYGQVTKIKKPIYQKWWFIVGVIVLVVIIASSALKKITKKGIDLEINWSDVILDQIIPEPPVKTGEIITNTSERLYAEFKNVSAKQYNDYIAECKKMGFTIDENLSSSSYEAYNNEGYLIKTSYYEHSQKFTISLDAPIKMGNIKWPKSEAGKLLPTPKSKKGKFSYEYSDKFFVYIGDTSIDDYNDYVDACMEKGFDVDYDKTDHYYSAKNADGWKLSLRYKGYNTMYIEINAPKTDDNDFDDEDFDDEDPDDEDLTETTKESEKTTEATTEKPSDEIRPDFKKAMDAYEEFIDEYVTFMKKYSESSGNVADMISDYTKYITKLSEMGDEFDKWGNTDLNDKEFEYYLEVQSRVAKKLASAV